MTSIFLPEELEIDVYRSGSSDIVDLSDSEIVKHYNSVGINEGRAGNRLATRQDFVSLIPSDARSLEIGPFFSPLLNGPKTMYFDVLDQNSLVERAKALGVEEPRCPYIDFVSPTGDLSIANESFDFVLSSHSIEHQPDLVSHLQKVESLLSKSGCYFVLVPDRRYCFDHYIADSTLADIVFAHEEKRKIHTLKSVIEHRALTTHNDCVRHWNDDHGFIEDIMADRVLAAISEYRNSNGAYIDVHAWYFTPESARLIFEKIHQIGLCRLSPVRIYPTRRNSNEFWMVLQKKS